MSHAQYATILNWHCWSSLSHAALSFNRMQRFPESSDVCYPLLHNLHQHGRHAMNMILQHAEGNMLKDINEGCFELRDDLNAGIIRGQLPFCPGPRHSRSNSNRVTWQATTTQPDRASYAAKELWCMQQHAVKHHYPVTTPPVVGLQRSYCHSGTTWKGYLSDTQACQPLPKKCSSWSWRTFTFGYLTLSQWWVHWHHTCDPQVYMHTPRPLCNNINWPAIPRIPNLDSSLSRCLVQ